MTRPVRPWVTAGLPTGAYEALAQGLPASRLRSLLLEVAEARAARRALPELMAQWDRDRFVQPAILDQRTLVEVDRHLLAATSAFESIELSPVARWASVPRWGIRARTRCYRHCGARKSCPIRPT